MPSLSPERQRLAAEQELGEGFADVRWLEFAFERAVEFLPVAVAVAARELGFVLEHYGEFLPVAGAAAGRELEFVLEHSVAFPLVAGAGDERVLVFALERSVECPPVAVAVGVRVLVFALECSVDFLSAAVSELVFAFERCVEFPLVAVAVAEEVAPMRCAEPECVAAGDATKQFVGHQFAAAADELTGSGAEHWPVASEERWGEYPPVAELKQARVDSVHCESAVDWQRHVAEHSFAKACSVALRHCVLD